MKNSKLLNEVIADAKAVKETAYRAAVETLKEQFEPTIRSMVSNRLAEDDDMDLDEEDEFELDENDDIDLDEDEDIDLDLDEDEDIDLDEEDDLEDTLDEILEELEDELDEEEDIDLDEEDDLEDTLDEILEELEDELDEEDDLDLEEQRRFRRKRSISEARRRVGSRQRNSSRGNTSNSNNNNSKLVRENRQLKHNLKEAYRAITKQKSTINEVNLMNSKLLYLSKLTNRHSIAESKQVKILEAFDRCTTLREVQIAYKALSDSLSKSTTGRKKLSESASKPSMSINNRRPLNENYSFSNRWQELAGIIKK